MVRPKPVIAALLTMGLCAVFFQPATAAAPKEALVECDVVRPLGASWQRQQSIVNTLRVVCFQVPGSLLQQRGIAVLAVELQVTRGAGDVYAFAAGGLADQLNADPVLAGTGLQTFTYPVVAGANTNIAVAPSFDATRLSYRLRLAPALTVPPPPAQPAGVTELPTTLDRPCSTFGIGLSNLCVTPYPVAFGGTAFAEWNIPNFRSGAFDRGDGRGFIGPIAQQQRVDVPGLITPRIVRVQWTDLQGRVYVDSILIPVAGQAATSTPQPIDTFPCSRAGLGVSNLCIEQPYPVKRGSTAFAVWRIPNFRAGEFDRGDGQGFRGPISAEQRVEIPNITAPRTVTLRWIDQAGVTRADSFTILVVD